MTYIRPLIQCLSQQGISVSFQSSNNPKLPEALQINIHRVGAIVLLDSINNTSPDNVLKAASAKRLFDYYVSWLLIASRPDDISIDTRLRNLTIGINTEVIVATSYYSNYNQSDPTKFYINKTCHSLHNYVKKYKYNDVEINEDINENVTKNLHYSQRENTSVCFYIVHIYKIRITDNSSLIVDPLGSWNPGELMLKLPVDVVLRNNFNRLPLIVGILNGTNEDQDEENSSYDEQTTEDRPLNDFINFLTSNLNASLETVLHEKVGTITNKVWSNLLGDVYNGYVDIGLGYITVNDERRRDMCFSHPLIRYTRNIYIRPPESGFMRDIFLQPFNNRLLLCVAFVHIVIILTISLINYITRNVFRYSGRKTTFGEATLWCTGIMCMQGTPWRPKTLSGKMALLASLTFALVMYNAYAGFITSILSVQATGIKTLEDLLQNNFKVGYSDLDDEFMRNTNDSNLRLLYIKAFNGRESRIDTTQGLQKAVKGGYGFFASATLARRTLRTSLIQERCSLKEIEVGQTFTIVALPMEKFSPYEKIINLSILRMRERGVIDRIGDRMLPNMPKCRDPTTFHSARIADVYSAFIILAIGIVTAVCIGLAERMWSKRKKFKNKLIMIIDIYLKKKDTKIKNSKDKSNDNVLSDYLNNDYYSFHFGAYKHRLGYSPKLLRERKVNDDDKQLQKKQIIFPFNN
ncbi:glutamate receptor 1-like [Microplitis mediator]|uniref:glutamate receptor 1-like n=1 Tax=Microplitis mediator TaxID=375433 RepID=UPI002554C43E|nr:glutamate receptor 1-like [Microplitis mediator]